MSDGNLKTIGVGYYWTDLKVGDKVKTLSRTITEADIIAFVGVTGMTEVLFTDQTFDIGIASKGRPAPGALVYTIIEGLYCQALFQATGLALLEIDQKILGPTFAGDTVHSEVEVLEIKPTSKGGRAVVTANNRIINQRGDVVIEYTAKRMMMGKPEGEDPRAFVPAR